MADLTLDEQQLQEQALEYARKNKKTIALRQRAQDAKVPDLGTATK